MGGGARYGREAGGLGETLLLLEVSSQCSSCATGLWWRSVPIAFDTFAFDPSPVHQQDRRSRQTRREETEAEWMKHSYKPNVAKSKAHFETPIQ